MLERGVTYGREFGEWVAGLVRGKSLDHLRKDLAVEVYDEAGQLALACKLYRCSVSASTVAPELDANANALAIESLKVENEGWERVV